MPTKSNLVPPDDFGSDSPNSNSALSGILPPIADSISSRDGFIGGNFLENVKHIHPPTTNSESKEERSSGLDGASCCASSFSVQTCVNRGFPHLVPSAIPSVEWMQEWRSQMCAMAPDWLSRCAKEWLSEQD